MALTKTQKKYMWISINTFLTILGTVIVITAGVIVYHRVKPYFLSSTVTANSTTLTSPSPENQTLYPVSRVIDGDTLEILMNSKKEKVRLIGINTPETVDPRKPVECFGKEASAYMNDAASGKNVYLEFDDTQGTRDTYGRLLAYVYLEDGQMLNRKMIADGYAYEYTYRFPYKYQKEFRELVGFAQRNARGLWSPTTCNGQK